MVVMFLSDLCKRRRADSVIRFMFEISQSSHNGEGPAALLQKTSWCTHVDSVYKLSGHPRSLYSTLQMFCAASKE